MTCAKTQSTKRMDAATNAALPDSLTVRELRVTVNKPGYRVKELVVATTLCEAAAYPKEDIAALYHDRWHAELDLRSIKSFLGLEMLRCQTPAMAARRCG